MPHDNAPTANWRAIFVSGEKAPWQIKFARSDSSRSTSKTGGWIIERLGADRQSFVQSCYVPPGTSLISYCLTPGKIHIQRDFHSFLSFSATPHGQLSKKGFQLAPGSHSRP